MDGALGLLWLLLGAALLVAPHALYLPAPQALALNAGGLLVLLLFAVALAAGRLWRKPKADRAFYRSGVGRPRVFIGTGGFVHPMLHTVQDVTLRSIALELRRSGAKGVRCRDNLRAELTLTVFLQVQATEEGVRRAATRFGEGAADGEAIGEHVRPQVTSAVDAVAAAMTVKEIHGDREAFVSRIHELVRTAVSAWGLDVESVTLADFDQGDPKHLNPANTLDAKALEMLWDDARRAAEAKEGLLKRGRPGGGA